MSVLNEICKKKRSDVETRKTNVPLQDLKAQIQDQPPPRGFIKRLKAVDETGLALITEVKKASPSKGLIRADFDPATIAKTYEAAGAACISVLTDEPYFQGIDEHFRQARAATTLPMIRKDFMLAPYQIYESRAMGADCILLIMAALDDSQARELYVLAQELGMDVLVEIHNSEELVRALYLDPAMIGINNRNLKTLKVDVATSFELLPIIPKDICKISESGLADHAMLTRLRIAGYSGFLVGESLMRQDDIRSAVKKLRTGI
ncbi:MAG: indole-3-glycerol phosphate synthase TrpC [Rhodospirillales bacterium]|nr:indole-3-glycerol phosphate synthase TrpC [Rhodospirillales bacterium]